MRGQERNAAAVSCHPEKNAAPAMNGRRSDLDMEKAWHGMQSNLKIDVNAVTTIHKRSHVMALSERQSTPCFH